MKDFWSKEARSLVGRCAEQPEGWVAVVVVPSGIIAKMVGGGIVRECENLGLDWHRLGRTDFSRMRIGNAVVRIALAGNLKIMRGVRPNLLWIHEPAICSDIGGELLGELRHFSGRVVVSDDRYERRKRQIEMVG